MVAIKHNFSQLFSDDWPRSLDEWDTVDDKRDDHLEKNYHRNKWPQELVPEAGSAAALVTTARISDVSASVFYALFRSRRDADWDSDEHFPCQPRDQPARWGLVSGVHYKILVLIHEAIRGLLSQHIPMLSKNAGVNPCRVWSICTNHINARLALFEKECLVARDPLRVLRLLHEWFKEGVTTNEVCPACGKRGAVVVKVMRFSIWSEIERICLANGIGD